MFSGRKPKFDAEATPSSHDKASQPDGHSAKSDFAELKCPDKFSAFRKKEEPPKNVPLDNDALAEIIQKRNELARMTLSDLYRKDVVQLMRYPEYSEKQKDSSLRCSETFKDRALPAHGLGLRLSRFVYGWTLVATPFVGVGASALLVPAFQSTGLSQALSLSAGIAAIPISAFLGSVLHGKIVETIWRDKVRQRVDDLGSVPADGQERLALVANLFTAIRDNSPLWINKLNPLLGPYTLKDTPTNRTTENHVTYYLSLLRDYAVHTFGNYAAVGLLSEEQKREIVGKGLRNPASSYIEDRNADQVVAKRLDKSIDKLGERWNSFPSKYYNFFVRPVGLAGGLGVAAGMLKEAATALLSSLP